MPKSKSVSPLYQDIDFALAVLITLIYGSIVSFLMINLILG